MLKTIRIRRFVGALAAILGVAALAIAQTSEPPPICQVEDASWAIADGGCKDLVSNLVWSDAASWRTGSAWSWSKMIEICNGLELNGHSDWRLPTVNEIHTAYEHGAWTHLQDGKGPLTWSNQSKGNKAYAVSLLDGVVGLHLKGSTFGDFCVRP
jgi:hypothetical protein